MKRWTLRLMAVALCVPTGIVVASPRALLIGVGDVRGAPLPAIDVDIDNMQKVAAILGFKPTDIKVMFNEQASLASVQAALDGWIRDGVRADDRVLIYFSGHGTRVADAQSKSGVDDALVMHDAEFVKGHLQNALLGRELGAAIAKSPSQHVLVLVDACHSGSATRDVTLTNLSLGTSTAVKRFFTYPGMPPPPAPTAVTRAMIITRSADVAAGTENYAALAAARDDEYATGTEQGGMFTLGIVGAIQQDARDGKHPSVDDLRLAATDYIAAHLNKESDRSHPVADGNPRLIRGELTLIASQGGQGPTWQSLTALAAKGTPLKVSAAGGAETHVGNSVTLQVDVPRHGYLNVVTVDSQDRATVLYPNRYNPSNEVQTGALQLPTPQMNFLLRAAEPSGPSLVVAFLTDRNINLLDLGVEGKDAAGVMQQAFTEVNGRGTRALVVEAAQEQIASGSLTMQVDAAAAAH